MAFCPMCKKQYGFSVTICPDCNVPLQEDAGDVKIPMFSLQKEDAAQGFIKFAEEQGISCAYEFSQRENAYKIFVSKKDQKKGPKLFSEFCVNETRKKKGYDAVPNAEAIKKAKEEEERKAAEAKKAEEERLAELARKAEEQHKAEQARKAEERRLAAEAKKKAAEEARKAREEAERKAAEEKRKADEKKKAEEEKMRVLEERRKAAEDERRAKRKAEEEKAAAEAAKKAEEERLAAEAKRIEAERLAEEARKEDEARRAEVERRAAEAERLAEEAAKKASESERIAAERKAEADRIVAERKAEAERILAERRKSAEEKSIKKESPSAEALKQLFEQKPAARSNAPMMGGSGFGQFKNQKEEVKNKDLLDLFNNPAQPAPKRGTYQDPVEERPQTMAGSRYEVAPGEDPVGNRPSDPFFSSAPRKTSVAPAEVSEPEIDEKDYYSSDPDFEPDMSDAYLSEEESYDPTASEPIFVEVEPIKDEELDSKDIVDAASVITLEQDEESDEEPEEEEDDAYAAFLTNFRKESVSAPVSEAADSLASSNEDILDNFINEMHNIDDTELEHSVIAEMVPDKDKYTDADDYRIESTSGRPKDIQDTKIKVSADSDIIEEVFDDNVDIGREQIAPDTASSFANDTDGAQLTQKAKKFLKNDAADDYSDLEDYKGFIPDYSFEEKKEEIEETPEQKAYREFTEKVAERKREMQLAAEQAASQQTRNKNLEHDLGKKKGKIVFEDTDELDSYAGFIPDYKPNTDNEAEFDFYKPHQVSSYAKFKKGRKDTSDSSLINMTHMRATNAEEIRNVFLDKVPNGVKNTIEASMVRSTGFLVSMSGKQLAQLFNSWLILNMTGSYVKQFEQSDATLEENTNNKIEGIKNTIRNTFGEVNESFLDYIVRRYYGKYLED